MSAPARPHDALRGIWEASHDEVRAQVGVLEAAVTAALACELDDGGRERAAREAHKLAGSVGTFGFAEASVRARELEHAFSDPLGPETDLPALAEAVLVLDRDLLSEAASEAVGTAPAADPAPGPGELDGSPDSLAPPPGTPVDLLVVDGDPRRARALLLEARKRGLAVMSATGLAAAREIVAERAPEMVLLDLSMPGELEPALDFLAYAAEERPVMVVTDRADRVDRVEVARRRGRGFLPHALPPAETVAAVMALRERVRAHGTRVLAIDDDPIVLATLADVLGRAGLEVSTGTDPHALFDQLDELAPDLLVLDYEMPSITGPDLCRAVRNDPRWEALPVLFLTGRSDPRSVRTVFDAGADDYVVKPFVGPEVTARIANRLERVRLYRALAETDHLTQLVNRRKSFEVLDSFMRMALRLDQPLSLGIVDVDEFKQINDRHGHAAGDAVLRGLADALKVSFRGEDTVARWSGDEFVIGMYGMSGPDARERLGAFLDELRGRPFGEAGLSVTFSAGVAEFPVHGPDVDTVYRAADRALSEAKAEGRDRVVPAGRAPAAVDVVLVEDDPVLGPLLEHALQTRGYRTHWLNDGVRAAEELAAAGDEAVAPLVLLDWDLPGLDGLRLLGLMAKSGKLAQTRVIMLTARGGEAEILEALEAGAVDHVTKPFSVPVLMQRVRRALER